MAATRKKELPKPIREWVQGERANGRFVYFGKDGNIGSTARSTPKKAAKKSKKKA